MDQKTDHTGKAASHFDLAALAKFSSRIIFAVFALFIITLAFLLYLNDREEQEKLIMSVDNTVSAKALALDTEINFIVKHVKTMKSIADRQLAKYPGDGAGQANIAEIAELEKTGVYHSEGDYSLLAKGTTINTREALGAIIASGRFRDRGWDRLKWILLGLELFDGQAAEHANSENISLSYYISYIPHIKK